MDNKTEPENEQSEAFLSNVYIGKDRDTKRRKTPINVRTWCHNIITHLASLKRETRDAKTEIQPLNLQHSCNNDYYLYVHLY